MFEREALPRCDWERSSTQENAHGVSLGWGREKEEILEKKLDLKTNDGDIGGVFCFCHSKSGLMAPLGSLHTDLRSLCWQLPPSAFRAGLASP